MWFWSGPGRLQIWKHFTRECGARLSFLREPPIFNDGSFHLALGGRNMSHSFPWKGDINNTLSTRSTNLSDSAARDVGGRQWLEVVFLQGPSEKCLRGKLTAGSCLHWILLISVETLLRDRHSLSESQVIQQRGVYLGLITQKTSLAPPSFVFSPWDWKIKILPISRLSPEGTCVTYFREISHLLLGRLTG